MPARRGGAPPAAAAAAGSPAAHPPPATYHQHPRPDAPTSNINAGGGGGGLVALHRARFVDWSPSPVVAAAASSDGSTLAAAREDGGIELWETEGWSCVLRIPGVEGASITSLAWVTLSVDDDEDENDGDDNDDEEQGEEPKAAPRLPAASPAAPLSPSPSQALVSAGLDGALTLWDLRARAPGFVLDAGGGAIWSLAVDERGGGGGGGGNGGSGKRLAAACDDGALRVLTAVRRNGGGSSSSSSSSSSSASLKLSAAFPRASGRALSVAWHPGGRALVSGSSEGTLRAWDVATRRELFRVDAAGGSGKSSSKSKKSGCGDEDASSPLWAVAVADDGTLATGDGEGCVSFWDAEHGTLLARFPGAHAADVLALVAAGGGGGDGGGSSGNRNSRSRGGRRRGRDSSSSAYEGAGSGGMIFSAGADGRVASFVHQGGSGNGDGDEEEERQRVRQRFAGGGGGGGQTQQQLPRRNGGWAAGPARAPHTHDVRCLALLSTRSPSPSLSSSSPSPASSGGEGGRGAGAGARARAMAAAARASAVAGPQLLVSGGADAQLIVYARSSFATEHPARACRAPQPPLLAVSVPTAGDGAEGTGGGGPALLLASQRRAVDVWRLGVSSCSFEEDRQEQQRAGREGGAAKRGRQAPPPPAFTSNTTNLAEGARVDVMTRPSRLARLELAGADHVLSSALASSSSSVSVSNGNRQQEQQQQLLSVAVAASTSARTVLFELREREGGGGGGESEEAGEDFKSCSVRRVPLPAGVPAAAAVAFAGPRRLLAAACEDGSLSVIDLTETEGAEEREEKKKMTVASLAATLTPPPGKSSSPASNTTASLSCPPVSGIAVSDCGRWAATWSTSGRSHVFDLKGLEHSWSPPPLTTSSYSNSFSSSSPSPLLAGAAFTADGDLLLLSSSGTLASYDVQGRFLKPPTPQGAWEAAGGKEESGGKEGGRREGEKVAAAAVSLGDLPGSPTGVSALPKAGSRAVLVCTPSALCAADLAAPRTPGKERAMDPRSRRAARAAAGGGENASPSLAPAPAGDNPRPLPLEHPCLGSFYLSPREALLVEAVWADVAARSLPPPVLRRRFGA